MDNYITRRHPARSRIAELTSTNDYYAHKADFVGPADKILAEFGWTLAAFNMPGDEGRCLATIVDIETESKEIGNLFVSWYRMPSGRYELTLYLV